MIWRRWQKKARNSFLGHSFTPFGPHALDWLLARTFGLHGDLVPDFRLIDYLVTLLSTENCPALNGQEDNQELLKEVLTEMGVFDSRMSIYLPYRQRHFHRMGYTGFEGRCHSLFPSFLKDLAAAVDLQNLLTALAYRLVIRGKVRHADIPDNPFVESERRQIFFAAAIGLPTVFIKADTRNLFLRRLLLGVHNQRPSRRYKGYVRIPLASYQKTLLAWLERHGADLAEQMNCRDVLADLSRRLNNHAEESALGRILQGTALCTNLRGKPEKIRAGQFNAATETYYRTDLRRLHTGEGVQTLIDDCLRLEHSNSFLASIMSESGQEITASAFIRLHSRELVDGTLPESLLRIAIAICLAVIHQERQLR